MNVNPHLQYLQQSNSQNNSQSQNSNQPVVNQQSPQVSHLHLQQQLQRQQLLNQHLHQQHQQQQQQQQPHVNNPLLGVVSGNNSNIPNLNSANSGITTSNNPGLNNILQQLQAQQLQQLQQSQHLSNQQQQSHIQTAQLPSIQPNSQQHQQSQIPIIKEVWANNLEHEFQALRSFVNDKTARVFVAIHQEIPGIIARPVGTFKSSSDYHFQTLRTNSDLLNLIQLSICVTKLVNHETLSSNYIWQFNFSYDTSEEMFNEEHLNMLSSSSQINLFLHKSQGIDHFKFSELIIESGLLLNEHVEWISYHAGYDLGFLLSLLINSTLPVDETEFHWWCQKYFPNFYDLKYISNQTLNKNSNEDKSNKPSIEYLAEELHLLPISPSIRQHFASSNVNTNSYHPQQLSSTLHAYLSMECFKELFRRSSFDSNLMSKFKGIIWGLGNLSNDHQSELNGSNSDYQDSSTPGDSSSMKSGALHLTKV